MLWKRINQVHRHSPATKAVPSSSVHINKGGFLTLSLSTGGQEGDKQRGDHRGFHGRDNAETRQQDEIKYGSRRNAPAWGKPTDIIFIRLIPEMIAR